MDCKKAPKVSYSTAHNNAVKSYKKTSLMIFWVGILGVFASLIGLIQMATGKFLIVGGVTMRWPQFGYSLAPSSLIMLARGLIELMPKNNILPSVLIFVISILVGSLFGFLGIFAGKGRIGYLIVGTSLYVLDSFAMIPLFLVVIKGQNSIFNLLSTIGVHLVVLGGLIIAFIQYFRVFAIERKYKGHESNESEVIAHGE